MRIRRTAVGSHRR